MNKFIKNTENLDDEYFCDEYFEGGEDKHYEFRDEENEDQDQTNGERIVQEDPFKDIQVKNFVNE